MRSEDETPIYQRFFMIMGRLAPSLIKELDDHVVPDGIRRLRERGPLDPAVEARLHAYVQRDRSRDVAFYTSYAYADIPLGRKYPVIWNKNDPSDCLAVDCELEHALFKGWFPVDAIGHGHPHILFLRFTGDTPNCIPVLSHWAGPGALDWEYGLSDSAIPELLAMERIGDPAR